MGLDDSKKEHLIKQVGSESYNQWYKRELPKHSVTLYDFFIGRYAVTQAQYQAVMGTNPSAFKGERRPVERVSWLDAIAFCKRLSELTGKKYRLPTEAEWEYACRAGTTTPYAFGETITPEVVNYEGTETVHVGRLPANQWGLHEMHGNIWEWCEDQWHEDFKEKPLELKRDGSIAWTEDNTSITSRLKSLRMLRGGNYKDTAVGCRSEVRFKDYSGLRHRKIGIRVVLEILPLGL